ncbi:helix-turn-helix domain-containing protein [Actinomadura litoris]|uniref:helix-turn-helix domain-containing protein n=1 Tax=Actinomadura litoris TaxID=2678616 RepID=UPI001FA76292|nr:helix-turn-helix domain-containing protein [Actinomadura litoris]
MSSELGVFLRARRARVRPSEAGLPPGPGARRTPGLRREELAALSGVSIDYYIRLEQGKETNPSGAVLDALARALRLDEEEHAHLYALADHAARRTPPGRGAADPAVRPAVRLLLENLRPCPAYALSRTGDVLAANPEALALYAGLADWPEKRRNTVRYVFLHPAARRLLADWDRSAAGCVANLRGVAAADPDAPDLAALVDELDGRSPEFAALWRRYDVRHRRGEEKVFRHPEVGELTLQVESLRLTGTGQRVTVYQAWPGTPSHDALALLSMAAGTGRTAR